MDLELTYQPSTGLTVSEELFGGNTLYSHNSLDADGSYVEALGQLGVNGLRYPGGTMTEEWGAAFYDDPNSQPAHLIDPTTFVGLDEFLTWTTANDQPATIVLPTSHLFVGAATGAAARVLDQAAVARVGTFVRDLLARHPDAEIASFEIGNEYWGSATNMTAEEYGILANAVSAVIQEVLDDVLGDTADQPAILAQVGEQWGRDFAPGGEFADLGLGWGEEVALANAQVLDQLSDAAKTAIDGLIDHYYYVETTAALTLGDGPTEYADRNFREISWTIAQWNAAFDPNRHGTLDVAITEWGTAWIAFEQWGLAGAGVVLEMFEGLLRLGADVAYAWPIELDGSVDFAGDHSGEDGADSDKLTALGQAFRLMAENTIGLDLLNNGFSAEDAAIETVEVNAYGNSESFVVFLSSRDDAAQHVTLDVSAYVPGFTEMSGERLSLINDGAHWNEARWFAETEAMDAAALGNSTTIDVTLGAYEVVMVRFSIDTEIDFVVPELTYIEGNAAGEEITGTESGDEIWGKAGNDTIEALGGNDLIHGNRGEDRVFAGDGDDFIKGRTGSDRLFGGDGDDDLRGNRGNDQIFGEAGDDFIKGCRGDDWLYGGEGNDVLIGGKGNDVLTGGVGHDLLTGGADADRFVFSAAGANTITDYETGVDVIDLEDLDTSFGALDMSATTGVIKGETVSGTLIDYGAGSVFLAGVSQGALDADDFLF